MTLLRTFTTDLTSGLTRASGKGANQRKYDQFVARYEQDPVGFCHDIAGSRLADYQQDILTNLVLKHRVAVRGPHGLGKTHLAANAIWWFIITYPYCKVITTASVFKQLKNYLWPEVHMIGRRIQWAKTGFEWEPGYLMKMQIEMGHTDWTAFAITSADHQKLEGAHAPHILIIFDEAKAIPNATFDALEGAMAHSTENTYAMAISTPGRPSGRFYDIHQKKQGYEDWWVRHVTLQEAIAAGRIDPDWAAQRKRQWGAESALYQNRVLGEFAKDDEESVIALSLAEMANERYAAYLDALREGQTPARAEHYVAELVEQYLAELGQQELSIFTDIGLEEEDEEGALQLREDMRTLQAALQPAPATVEVSTI